MNEFTHPPTVENTAKAYAGRTERPISTPSDSEPARVENSAQNGLECDTREKLEADVYDGWLDDFNRGKVLELLNRQAAKTEREIYKREQFHEKTQDMVEQIETQGIEIDGLIAERDGLRRALETQEHLAGQASRDYLRVLDRADELQNQVDSLTAERDDLRSRLKTQADSFQKLERENAQLRDKLERVRELLGGDA